MKHQKVIPALVLPLLFLGGCQNTSNLRVSDQELSSSASGRGFANAEAPPEYMKQIRQSDALWEDAKKLVREKDYKGAKEKLEAAIQVDPDNVLARISVTNVYSQLGEPQKAWEQADTILRGKKHSGSYQTDPTFLVQFAEVSQKLGKTEDAEWAFAQAGKQLPSSVGDAAPPVVLDSQVGNPARAYLASALDCYFRGEDATARTAIEKAVSLNASEGIQSFQAFFLLDGNHADQLQSKAMMQRLKSARNPALRAYWLKQQRRYEAIQETASVVGSVAKS